MTNLLLIMIVAVVAAIGVMLVFAGAISAFIERHPTTKVLALAFLLLIGVLLVAEGFGQHVPRGYVYFALAFSLGVEGLNIRARIKRRRKAEREAATAPAGG
jgi:predicted tellurium resistance membrane protein TerC